MFYKKKGILMFTKKYRLIKDQLFISFKKTNKSPHIFRKNTSLVSISENTLIPIFDFYINYLSVKLKH